jgi:hypothetical protein
MPPSAHPTTEEKLLRYQRIFEAMKLVHARALAMLEAVGEEAVAPPATEDSFDPSDGAPDME